MRLVVGGFVYPALLVLGFFGLTIFIHELGHFLMAKWRGMKIERFSIGFGPKIFGWTGRDGIDYRVSWILFGGYVALPQMSPMEALEGKTETKPEELPTASPVTKILVSLFGPFMNLVLALGIALVVWWVGMPSPSRTMVVGWIEPNSAEEQAGIRVGDRIVSVNGQTVQRWSQMLGEVANSPEAIVMLNVERQGEILSFQLEAQKEGIGGARTLNLCPKSRPLAQRILPGTPAEMAGLQPGDRFLSVAGVPIYSADQLRGLIGKRADQATAVHVLRDHRVTVLTVTPRVLVPKAKQAQMGVALGDEVVRPGPNPVEQAQEVLQLMWYTVTALVHHKDTNVGIKDLSGPVGIMTGLWGAIAYGGVRSGLWLAVMLNINLAILNLLPLPVLDGGHIVFATIESFLRRPLNARLVHALSVAFASVLIAFMLYITFFDVQRLAFSRRAPSTVAPTEPAVGSTETHQP